MDMKSIQLHLVYHPAAVVILQSISHSILVWVKNYVILKKVLWCIFIQDDSHWKVYKRKVFNLYYAYDSYQDGGMYCKTRKFS